MFRSLLIATALAITLAALLAFSGSPPIQDGTEATAYPPTIRMLQDRSELTVLQVDVATVVAARKSGWLGSVKACLIINGTATIGTDLAEAHFKNINTRSKTATLVLAEPALMHVGISAKHTEVYDVHRSGLYRLAPFSVGEAKVINRAMSKAHDQLIDAVDVKAYSRQAKAQAEAVVQQLARDVGWVVKVVWQQPGA